MRLFGTVIEPGASNRLVETVNARDEARILREVRNAANMADYVIVNSHSHEPGNDSVVPPEWLRDFVKKCLDAGGTTFVVHGPHQLRGIEMYKGKPIFYSLGNFVFQNETIDPMPSDHYEQFDLPAHGAVVRSVRRALQRRHVRLSVKSRVVREHRRRADLPGHAGE